MRTKSLLFIAALSAASMGAALAQAPVYSANVVGYINIVAPKGLSLIANQLDNKNGNKVSDVIPALPDGSFLHLYVGGAQGYNSLSFFGGWEDAPAAAAATLAPGQGAFLAIPDTALDAERKLTFVGEVAQGAASNGSIPSGLSIISSRTPRAGKVSTDLKFPSNNALDGSFLYIYENAKKDYTAYSIFDGWELPLGEPSLGVGEAAFFLNANAAAQPWNQDFVVQ